MTGTFSPSPQELVNIIRQEKANTIPIYCEISSDLNTPVSAYLKLSHNQEYSFLLESVAGGEKLGRYSFLGTAPYKVTKSGESYPIKGDPLIPLEKEFQDIKYHSVKGLPSFSGGAIGYISYDCIKYFEPRTARPLADPLKLPESVFLYCDTIVVFDHLHQLIKVVSHYRSDGLEESDEKIKKKHEEISKKILEVVDLLNSEFTPKISQGPIVLGQTSTSNKGKAGYEGMVTNLKRNIFEGDIIQVVPSQRLSRPTSLHPFNIYRRLRSVNPSPYMFYMDLNDFQLVGASPETLVKVENRIVETHPIAGTKRRGATPEEDLRLEKDLLADEKERAEHIMLVDLGRNDINRVCLPDSVVVDSLMHIERYSHVMHIVSRIKGHLRPDKTPFDAFRSIFPAGTLSGAPKIRAVELISEQEGETRGVYGGAAGYFGFSGDQDTCIAIRTMVVKDGIAYLQAGAGIVHDSEPEAEYEETVSKLGSNLTAIATAEQYHFNLQSRIPHSHRPASDVTAEADSESQNKRRKLEN